MGHVDSESTGVKVFAQAPHRTASDPTSRKGALFGKIFMSLLGLIFVGFLCLMASDGEHGMAVGYATFVVLVTSMSFYYPWMRRTLRYEIRQDSVVIVRAWPFRDIAVPISEIIGVSRPTMEKSEVSFPEGWFRSRLANPTVRMPSGRGTVVITRGLHDYSVGANGIELFASVTSAQRLVAIECEDRSYLISPEHPDEFVRDIRVMI